jgi:Lar family restriction alleviation protein
VVLAFGLLKQTTGINPITITVSCTICKKCVIKTKRLVAILRSVTKMADNKTCPFCGSNRIEVYMHYGESAGIKYGGYYPECTVCGCRLNYYESREEALKAWNERANDGRE